jgi:hypothetical protein
MCLIKKTIGRPPDTTTPVGDPNVAVVTGVMLREVGTAGVVRPTVKRSTTPHVKVDQAGCWRPSRVPSRCVHG